MYVTWEKKKDRSIRALCYRQDRQQKSGGLPFVISGTRQHLYPYSIAKDVDQRRGDVRALPVSVSCPGPTSFLRVML